MRRESLAHGPGLSIECCMKFLSGPIKDTRAESLAPQEESVMLEFIRRLARDCSGPTAIEYGLIAGLVAVVTIAGLTTLGTTLNAKYAYLTSKVAS